MAVSTLALVGRTPSAQAQGGQYGCACLNNGVNVTIKYRFRWGDGEWSNSQVSPGYVRWMCWNYGTGPRSSPPLQFQMDVDMTGGTQWTTYNIERLQSRAQDCNVIPQRAHYDVKYRPGTNNTQIYITRRN